MERFIRWSIATVLTIMLSYLMTPPGVMVAWWKFFVIGFIMNMLVDLVWQKIKPQE